MIVNPGSVHSLQNLYPQGRIVVHVSELLAKPKPDQIAPIIGRML